MTAVHDALRLQSALYTQQNMLTNRAHGVL